MRQQLKWNTRQKVIERDGICLDCGNEFDLEIHHKYSVTDFPEYKDDIDTCWTLCTGCHYELHKNGFKNYLKEWVEK